MNNAEQKTKKAISQREQELNDLKSVLDTDYGKRFVQRLINRAGIFQPTYASGSSSTDFAFMEGRREFGLFILAEVTQADHEAWLVMQRKQFTEKQIERYSDERHTND